MMTFEKVLKAMRKGKKARRKTWGKYAYIKIGIIHNIFIQEQETFVTRFNNEINITRMIFENDWELLDE
jgi:hypothetical protein